jgi:hypothetical protein
MEHTRLCDSVCVLSTASTCTYITFLQNYQCLAVFAAKRIVIFTNCYHGIV